MTLMQRFALMTDDQAFQALQKLVRARLAGSPPIVLPDDLRLAIAQEHKLVPVPPNSVAPPSAARHALVLAAQGNEKEVEVVLDAAEAQSLLLTVGILTAAVVILQTEFDVKKDKDGKWTVAIRRMAASDDLIKSFLRSVLGLPTS